jgi:DNA replication protein DnaC
MEAEKEHLKTIHLEVPRRFADRTEIPALSPLLTPQARKALDYCRRWAENPAAMPGPLLMGKSGVFKTHIVWATARMIYERVHNQVRTAAQRMIDEAYAEIESGDLRSPSAFRVDLSRFSGLRLIVTDGAQIAHDVRSTVEKKNLDEIVQHYRQHGRRPAESPLLIDDVEVMKLSDWLHEELYRIFDYRYQEAMPTFVATNLSSEELRAHLGDRIARRIMDMTEPFKLC